MTYIDQISNCQIAHLYILLSTLTRHAVVLTKEEQLNVSTLFVIAGN